MKALHIVLSVGIFSLFTFQAQLAFAETQSTPIVGGTVVAASDVIAKRTAALYFLINENGQKGAAICSGSILDDSHILTAAHCVQGFQSGYVVFSSSDIFTVLKQAASAHQFPTGGKVQPMVSAVALPGFPGMDAANGSDQEFPDLAVIQFRGGLPAGYEAAHFLPKVDLLKQLSKKPSVTLAGYGMITPPQAVKKSFEAGSASGFPIGVGILHQVTVHTVGVMPHQVDVDVGGIVGHNACEGDSGGPAMISVNGDVFVIGVDSRGDCRTTSLYTLVYRENTANLSNNAL